MKPHSSLFVLLASLALLGCHRSGGYSATAVIRIQPRETTSVGSPTGTITQMDAQNEFEVIESPDVLSPVITDLQLDRIWAKRLNKGEILPMQDALKYLQSHLRLMYRPGTRIIDITVFSDNPRETADIANGIAYRYKAVRDNAEKQLAESGVEVLRDQITQQEQVIKDAEAKAKENPQDSNLQKESQYRHKILQALESKLQQVEEDAKHDTSPVQILTNADPKPSR